LVRSDPKTNDKDKGKDAAVAERLFGLRSRFLHCAAHDETVSSFGRNDSFCGWEEKAKTTASWMSGHFVIPPIAKCAMDGAPVDLWGVKGQAKAMAKTRATAKTRQWLRGCLGGEADFSTALLTMTP